jgi:hypothetical protein
MVEAMTLAMLRERVGDIDMFKVINGEALPSV